MVDFERHSRHITLPNVGIEGQTKLSQSKILCVGAGGLGSPVIQYLAAAGVGKITVIDDDVVNLSNLQRQVIHRTPDVGIPKVESAKRFVNGLDPNIEIIPLSKRLTEENIESIFANQDVIVDGTDNIKTRYLIDEMSKKLGKPWVYGSVYRFEGQVSVFNYQGGPSYSDLFPEAPPDELIPNCAEAGVFGALTGIIGCLQATEVIKILIGIGQPLVGRLLIYDALESKQRLLKFGSIEHKQVEKPVVHTEQPMIKRVDASEAISLMEGGWSPKFYDVRSEMEWMEARISGAEYLCAHTDILSVAEDLPKDEDILIHCRSGVRSELAIAQLISVGFDAEKMYNLEGGIIGWAQIKPDGIIQG
tara:strand:+ start:844 stop:1929 length:1086 start_codon:yes stop_codon:yes gene_type:complete